MLQLSVLPLGEVEGVEGPVLGGVNKLTGGRNGQPSALRKRSSPVFSIESGL